MYRTYTRFMYYQASNAVLVLEMERVIDIAFDSDDEQLRKDAARGFESIKTFMRTDKIFRLGCKVQ